MKHQYILLAGIPMILLAGGSAQAAQFLQLHCPDEISPAEVRIAARAGWRTHVPYALPLFGAGMSSGSPESEMQLRGEPLDAGGGNPGGTSYRFDGAGKDEERWLDCRYGKSGEFTMSRRLDDRIRQCIIKHHELVPGNPRRIDIRCR